MDLASSVLSDNPVHEVEKFKPSPPLVLTPRHLARRNVESGEERRRAMPGVVVRLAPGRSASSDSPASAPALGSTASRRRPEPEHFRAASCKGRPPQPPWPRNRDRCFRTSSCARRDRSCGCARSARHIAHRRRRGLWRSAAHSSARSPREWAGRVRPGGACRSRPYIWAHCLDRRFRRGRAADVQYVWRLLRTHKIDLAGRKSWCESNDPDFAAKAAAVVGLYMKPPENALVLAVDEKPSIQALERS